MAARGIVEIAALLQLVRRISPGDFQQAVARGRPGDVDIEQGLGSEVADLFLDVPCSIIPSDRHGSFACEGTGEHREPHQDPLLEVC